MLDGIAILGPIFIIVFLAIVLILGVVALIYLISYFDKEIPDDENEIYE